MKVALIGTCPSSKLLAPFGNPEWQCWVFSPDNVEIPHVDVWFDIHGDYGWPGAQLWEKRYIAWLSDQKFPVYVQQIDLIPNGILFPAEELVAEFGCYWFTSSVAWLMAYALTKGVTEIGLYGIDMTTKDEYLCQRPGVHYWMEVAARRGVRIYVPPESDLLQPPPLYGYSETSPIGRKLTVRHREITQKVNVLTAELKRIEGERNHLLGALDQTEYAQLVWTGDQKASISNNLILEK